MSGLKQEDKFEKVFRGFPYATKNAHALGNFRIQSGRVFLGDDAASNTSQVAAFWTAVDARGAYVACPTTADSFNTVVDISGSAGICSALIGPVVATTDQCHWRITVDGKIYTVRGSCDGGDRSVLGAIGFTNAQYMEWAVVHSDEDIIVINNASSSAYIWHPRMPVNTGGSANTAGGGASPVLGFVDSLKIEFKTQAATINVSAHFKNAGAVYYLLDII